MIHRDIKTENILVGKDLYLKIADFGLASQAQRFRDSTGTPGHLAPEIENLTNSYDGVKVDIFNLGIVLFSMLFGCLPFTSATKTEVYYRKLIKNRPD